MIPHGERPRVLSVGQPQANKKKKPEQDTMVSTAANDPVDLQSQPSFSTSVVSSSSAAGQAAEMPNNKKQRSVWGRHEHGSYKHYYGARRPPAASRQDDAAGADDDDNDDGDVRLSLLKEEWFREMDYLDVGTNTGM